jgi:exonuclease VII small subunit
LEKPFQRPVVYLLVIWGLSEESAVEDILNQAERLEKEYEWHRAAESYEKALKLLPEDDFSRKAETLERLGYALYRAAFQTESNDEFKEVMHRAVLSYRQAKELYSRFNDPLKTPKMQRCDAMATLAGYWLAEKVLEKRKLLDECWELTKDALEAFKAGNAVEYGKTFNELSASVDLGYYFHETFRPREKIIREAVELGERAIELLSELGDRYELSRAYAKTALYAIMFYYYFASPENKKRCSQKAADYWQKAKETSEETAMLELPSILFGCGPDGYWGSGTDDALNNFEKAFEYSRKTRDKFLIGRALDLLAYHKFWRIGATEDPDEKTVLQSSALKLAEDAKHQYMAISFTSPRGGTLNWAEGPYLWYYWQLAGRETDLNRKREFLKKALEVAPGTLRKAENSGYLDIREETHSTYASVLRDLAKIEANSEEKRGLLEKALAHNEESIAISEQIEPSAYWNLGFMRGNAILTRQELADLAKDPENKKIMLQKVLQDSEDALELCVRAASYEEENFPMLVSVAYWEVYNGDLLCDLHKLSGDKEFLKRAAEAFHRGIETYQKTKQTSRLAESFWKIARTYDALGEHTKAGDNFIHASKSYKSAAETIPQLKEFYQDHALYMQAWNDIENARYHHERQEYGPAEQHFQNAANMHKSLKKWSYLAPNYYAWAQVEHAEDLSRKEQSEEAFQAFEQAVKLFDETKRSIQNELSKIEDLDEKQMANSMVKATDTRHQYCEARIAVEEAKILDKKGEHYSSSKRYGSAAETFERISQRQESEQEKREVQLIAALSRAWQKMTLAEAEASPTLYAEASEVFEQARDCAPNEKTRMLILGHSRFCRALEAGTKFADTRDQALHALAVQHLASASNYYIKADFQTASEYAKATKLLFDAYLYMDNAEKEGDPEKKAKLYVMIERVLQTSAGSYTKAEHPEKREQMLKLLEKAKEERELAASMTEALHTPSIVSATTAFTTPTPTQERAVGSERFEHADIQANLRIRQKELKVGEPLNLKIDLVNAGKAPALLIKIDEVIPEGFELGEKPETFRIEDSYIDMKGKLLGPLKTEELRLVLKPKIQGTFTLKPTISYLDENGKYKSHEPEPVTITVKELGIKGWLKGEK